MKAQTNKSASSAQGETSNPYLAFPGKSRNYDNKPPHQRIQLSTKRTSDAILGNRTGPKLMNVASPKTRNEAPSRGKLPVGLYGNYVHYYTSRRMHGEKEDPRMSLMDSSLFTDKKVLDIGCNSGNLTILLALKHKPIHIDGVDIDERLIKTAVNNLKSTYSLRDPESDAVDTDIGLTSHYYPQSMTYMFGFLPLMPRERAPPGFPYNVHFKSEDWLNVETEKQKYDTILA
ncbi:hypothetical protein NQZ79_g4504 [Umbelopsis isabellina]|nr:hypothetical protein NQZ79_g4504 [Umbelopsis isabellina]